LWWRPQPPAYPPGTSSSVKEYLEANYLNPELHLPTAADAGRVWDLDWFALARPPLEPSAPRIMLAPAWEPPFRRGRGTSQSALESQVWDPESVQMEMGEVFGSGTEGLAPRMPGPAKDFVRGSINNRPFRPGGLLDDNAEVAALDKAFPEGARNGDWVHELMTGGLAQVAPPGFRKGLELGQLKVCRLLNFCLFCLVTVRIVVDVPNFHCGCWYVSCRSIKATGSVSGMENL